MSDMTRSDQKSSHTPLASLLLPAAASPNWNDADLAALLLHQLQTPLDRPGDPAFGEILLSPSPDIARLRQVKDFAKSFRDDPRSGIPSEICQVLYYAAIAAAQVNTPDRLTSLDSDSFRRGLKWAVALHWIPESLKTLFEQALERQK